MGRARKYTTYNKVRLALFTHSYGCYSIAKYIWSKYKINNKLTQSELRKKYFDKRAIPEISKLSHSLNLDYRPLWQAILLNKKPPLSKNITGSDGIRFYLAIEEELIALAESKRHRSRDFFDPDYENEFAVLSIAIERAAGSFLNDIEDDFVLISNVKKRKRYALSGITKLRINTNCRRRELSRLC